MLFAGQTLLIPSGPSGFHLHVILCAPCLMHGYGTKANIMMVGITTIYPGIPHDPACVLNVGDHSFIQHPSFAYYRSMRVDSEEHVRGMLDSGAWRAQEELMTPVLQRLIDGVCLSKLATREFKKMAGCAT